MKIFENKDIRYTLPKIFKDEQLAIDAKKLILQNEESKSLNIVIDNDETRTVHFPWGGYFERLSNVDYVTMVVS